MKRKETKKKKGGWLRQGAQDRGPRYPSQPCFDQRKGQSQHGPVTHADTQKQLQSVESREPTPSTLLKTVNWEGQKRLPSPCSKSLGGIKTGADRSQKNQPAHLHPHPGQLLFEFFCGITNQATITIQKRNEKKNTVQRLRLSWDGQ